MLHACEICLEDFSQKYLLILHKRSHSDIYKCFHCNQNYESVDKFSEHLNIHILQQKVTQFQCGVCQKIFKNKNEFIVHFEDHLNGPECIKSGTDAIALESTNYICTMCDKPFLRLDLCKQHLSKHVSDLRCNICGKSFTRYEHLLNHTRAHTQELPLHCTQCTRSFFKKEHLTRHIRTHSKGRIWLTLKCTVCPMQFNSNLKLTSHLRSHTKNRPFECGQCNRFFVTAGNLKFHEKTHHHSQNTVELKIEAM